MEFRSQGNGYYRFFRIVGLYFQGSVKTPLGRGSVSEEDIEHPSRFDHFQAVGHFFGEGKGHRLKLQGPFLLGGYRNSLGQDLSFIAFKNHVLGKDVNGYLDKGPDSDGFNALFRVIAEYPCRFLDCALVAPGVDLYGDFSLPARGNGSVETDQRTASTRLDIFYQKVSVSRVPDAEGMLNNLLLIDIPGVIALLHEDHLRHSLLPGMTQGAEYHKGEDRKNPQGYPCHGFYAHAKFRFHF